MRRLIGLSISFLLLIPACSVAEDIGSDASISTALQQQIVADAEESFRARAGHSPNLEVQGTSFELAGFGNILPNEKQQGVEELICGKVKVNWSSITFVQWFDENQIAHGEQRDVVGTYIRNYIIDRTGDYWKFSTVSDSQWKMHSCPDIWEESISEETPSSAN